MKIEIIKSRLHSVWLFLILTLSTNELFAQYVSWEDQNRTTQEAGSILIFFGGNQGLKAGMITTGFKKSEGDRITPYTGYSFAYYSSKPIFRNLLFENEFGISRRGFQETKKVTCGDFNFFLKGRFVVDGPVSPFVLAGFMGYWPLSKKKSESIETYVEELGGDYTGYYLGGGGLSFGAGTDFGKKLLKFDEKRAGFEVRYCSQYAIPNSFKKKQYFLTFIGRIYLF
jgi:hypothetical protein